MLFPWLLWQFSFRRLLVLDNDYLADLLVLSRGYIITYFGYRVEDGFYSNMIIVAFTANNHPALLRHTPCHLPWLVNILRTPKLLHVCTVRYGELKVEKMQFLLCKFPSDHRNHTTRRSSLENNK